MAQYLDDSGKPRNDANVAAVDCLSIRDAQELEDTIRNLASVLKDHELGIQNETTESSTGAEPFVDWRCDGAARDQIQAQIQNSTAFVETQLQRMEDRLRNQFLFEAGECSNKLENITFEIQHESKAIQSRLPFAITDDRQDENTFNYSTKCLSQSDVEYILQHSGNTVVEKLRKEFDQREAKWKTILQAVVIDLEEKLQQQEKIGQTVETDDRLLKHNYTQTSFGELDLTLNEHVKKIEKLGNEIKVSIEGLLDIKIQQEEITNMTRYIQTAVGSITTQFQEINEKMRHLTTAVEQLSPREKLLEKF